MADIPPNAADVVVSSGSSREVFELEWLETERALRALQRREIGQRYWLRWIAVGVGLGVILGMAAMLITLILVGIGRADGMAVSVAMIVAPIASITAITVALFVGAFRRFEEGDAEAVGNGVSTAARFMPRG
ncbi:MAG: hypothetical protein ACK5MQ_17320 [Pikeienuella sp.]